MQILIGHAGNPCRPRNQFGKGRDARLGQPAQAQVESFMLQRGSNVGPATQIKPINCVTAADGSVTCDTKIENPPSDTPAKPSYQPFKN